MNIIQILWKLGYDVLSFNEDGEYKIQFSKARKDRMNQKMKDGSAYYDFSFDDTFTVKVVDIGFNGLGNLYLSFEDVENGDCIDCYEHNNMTADELF